MRATVNYFIKTLPTKNCDYLLLQQDCVHCGKHFDEQPGGHDVLCPAGALDLPTGCCCCACGKFIAGDIGALYNAIAPLGPMQHRGAQSGRHP